MKKNEAIDKRKKKGITLIETDKNTGVDKER